MRRYIPYQAKNQNNSGTFLFKNISNLKYFFIASIILTLFQNIDILIVKSLFDSETTGYYAAISVLAKFLIFLGLSIETVYYPQLVKESSLPTLQLLRIS
jgi:O-antigen/teichoic acid export membrane protein